MSAFRFALVCVCLTLSMLARARSGQFVWNGLGDSDAALGRGLGRAQKIGDPTHLQSAEHSQFADLFQPRVGLGQTVQCRIKLHQLVDPQNQRERRSLQRDRLDATPAPLGLMCARSRFRPGAWRSRRSAGDWRYRYARAGAAETLAEA
jgi:hypothetical protein